MTHPVWVVVRGWVAAAAVNAGEAVGTLGGGSATVLTVGNVRGPLRVYSLVTETGANFYVGCTGLDVGQWADQPEHFLPPKGGLMARRVPVSKRLLAASPTSVPVAKP